MWEPSVPCDSIRITVPSGIVLKEFLNVADYSQEGNLFIIKKLRTNNFFGLTVASDGIIGKPHVSKKINISLIQGDKEVLSKDFVANIYRPYVQVVASLGSITVSDEAHQKVPLQTSLKLSGFGKIQIRIEVSTGGEFIERAEPLYQEIVRKTLSSFREHEKKGEKKNIVIDPLYVQRKVKEYIERIEKRDFPLDVGAKEIEEFNEWMGKDTNREKVMELITKNLERLIVDSLLFYFDRYPTENIQMPQGKPVMVIEKATQKVTVRFRYMDALLNEYEPVEIAVNINDLRENKARPLEIPIDIHWIFEIINPSGECK